MANDCSPSTCVRCPRHSHISHQIDGISIGTIFSGYLMCFWWNCFQMCIHSKIDIWIRLSNGFPFARSTPYRLYVKSNGGNFRAIFRSFSFSNSKMSQIKLQIELVFRESVARCICGETQKWIPKMREEEREKRRYYGRPLVDWCYHRNKYIHHCDSQENGFCSRNNSNHNENHSQIRIQFDENSLWFDRIRIYHKQQQQQQQYQPTEMLIEYRVRLHPHHQ